MSRMNCLWNDQYITFISQTGAGESFLQDDMGRRLGLVKDRAVFLTEGDRHWGALGLPANEKRAVYFCLHQRGATEIRTEQDGIVSVVSVIVPGEDACELWNLKIKNMTEEKRQIRALAFFGSAFDEAYTRQGYNVKTARFDAELNGVVANAWNAFGGTRRVPCYGFMTLFGQAADGYACTHNAIIGPYGSFACPTILEKGVSNTDGCGENSDLHLKNRQRWIGSPMRSAR